MRIKRTDRDFTVRRKADRKIHYAGQGKKYTENTVSFSPKEKLDALKQKNFPGAGIGIMGQTQVQKHTGVNGNTDFETSDTVKSYQQEYGSSTGGRIRNRGGDLAVYGNLHVRKPFQKYRKESAPYDKGSDGNSQAQQHQHSEGNQQIQQEIQTPSAYHENAIKTKEPVLHRKEDTLSGIKRADNFCLKERRGRREKLQEGKSIGSSKIHRKTVPENPGRGKRWKIIP